MRLTMTDPAGDEWQLAGGAWWRTPPRPDRAWNAVPGSHDAPPTVLLEPGESIAIEVRGTEAILYGHALPSKEQDHE